MNQPNNTQSGSSGSGGGIGGIIVIGVIILILIAAIGSCSSGGGGGSSHKVSTATCKSCGRTWEAGDDGGNFMQIAKSGMCKTCYNNYMWGKDYI